jgi:hypothetical protein
MIRMTALAVALALGACTTAPIVEAHIRADGLAKLGQPTGVARLVVTPKALIEDSRCPINARCIWAGRVVLRSQIDGAGWRETRDLVLGEPQSVRESRIALTSARPDKQTGVAVPPSAYLFGFEGGR